MTTLDAEAILRARSESSRPRSRLLSFITGDTDNAEPREPASPGSVAPPPDEVRREMLRLKLEAERADLESEVLALGSDAIVQGRIVLTVPGADADAAPADAAPAPADADAAPGGTDTPPRV